MQVKVYGEDGITLWLIQNKLKPVEEEVLKIYYRLSFGRIYGFGEFDLIYFTDMAIHLCECKWHNERTKNVWKIKINEIQSKRHKILQKIIEMSFIYNISFDEHSWNIFYKKLIPIIAKLGYKLPQNNTLINNHIKSFLIDVHSQYNKIPRLINNIIAFYSTDTIKIEVDNETGKIFKLNKIKYQKEDLSDLVNIEM